MDPQHVSRPNDLRRTLRASMALTVGAALLLAPAAALGAPGDVTVSFASDTTWVADDADPAVGPTLTLPANAQYVCLNVSAPPTCPVGATLYGWVGPGWGADLSSIPGAGWIWAPAIDDASTPADADTYTFSKTISIPGTPVAGSISVAVDDSAEVFVNGTSAGTAAAQDPLTTLDITSLLVSGANTIVVQGWNNSNCGAPCAYTSNPAGVVFGGSITYTPAAAPTAAPTLPPTSTTALPGTGTGGSALPWLALIGTLATIGASALILRERQRR